MVKNKRELRQCCKIAIAKFLDRPKALSQINCGGCSRYFTWLGNDILTMRKGSTQYKLFMPEGIIEPIWEVEDGLV